MRAATIVLVVLRLGTCLRHASSFRAHRPSSAAAAVRNNGAAAIILTGTKAALPPTSASSTNRDRVDRPDRAQVATTTTTMTTAAAATRRSFAEDAVSRFSIVGCLLAYLPPYSSSSNANASGGATAGGAYLLSAKQRYNKRVLSGIKSFLSIDARDLGEVNAYFASTEEGGWEDLSAAGYLLSNAFRTSSTKAPDALPSVKKWKAFAREIELLKLASSKKNAEKVLSAYASASEKLDDYLAAVELPSGMELKQMK